ncbi:MAG TPA: hypothetical protein VI653_04210 [Steroidobacteraceae bacterium]
MPTPIKSDSDIQPGEIYEDGAYHPCLCLGVVDGQAWGISLVDGSYPRHADLRVGGTSKLTLQEAWQWRTQGPSDVDLAPQNRWW